MGWVQRCDHDLPPRRDEYIGKIWQCEGCLLVFQGTLEKKYNDDDEWYGSSFEWKQVEKEPWMIGLKEENK